MLSDDEIYGILESGPLLADVVRKSGKLRSGKTIDVETVRKWLTIPTQSSSALAELPALFRRRYEVDNRDTAHGPGVRALIALADCRNEDEFRASLERIRSGEVASSDEGNDYSLRVGLSTDDLRVGLSTDDLDEASRLIAELRELSERVKHNLGVAGERATSGDAVGRAELVELIDTWNAARTASFAALTTNTIDSGVGFQLLEELLERAESARKHAVEQQLRRRQDREVKKAQLETYEQSLGALTLLKDTGPEMKRAYNEAVAKIAELQAFLAPDELIVEHEDVKALSTELQARSGDDDSGPDTGEDQHSVSTVATESEQPEKPRASRVEPTFKPKATPELKAEPEVKRTAGDAPARKVVRDVAASVQQSVDSEADMRVKEPNGMPAPSAQTSPSVKREHVAKPQDCNTPPADAEFTESSDAPALDVCGELETHLTAGRYGAAWAVAVAAGRPEADINAYRLAAAAFHSGPGRLEPSEVLTRFTVMDDRGFSDADTARVAVASLLRAALSAGWAPTSEMADVITMANLDMQWSNLLAAAQAAGTFVPQHSVADSGGITLDEVQKEAHVLLDALSKKRINFTRADNVRRYLLRTDEVLGRAFAVVTGSLSSELRRKQLSAIAAELANVNKVIAAADEAVSSRQQLRASIIGNARNSLEEILHASAGLVEKALTATVAVTNKAGNSGSEKQSELLAAARLVISTPTDGSPGLAALHQLVSWILSNDALTWSPRTAEEVLLFDTLPIVDVLRDLQGVPQLDNLTPVERQHVIVDLHDFGRMSPEELVKAYVATGNLMAAEVAAASDLSLMAVVDSARSDWIWKLGRRVEEARGDIGQTYANDYTQRDQVNAEAKLVGPSQYRGDRYDLQLQELFELRESLKVHRAATAADLRAKIEDLPTSVSEEDRKFIGDRISDEDFVGAHELLALASDGKPLPKLTNSEDGNAYRFNRFREIVLTLQLTKIDELIDQFEAANGTEVPSDYRKELQAWTQLGERRSSAHNQHRTMEAVLSTIGLHLKNLGNRQIIAGRNDMYQVRAARLDKSLVPGLGSAAPHYQVAVVSDQSTLRQTVMAFNPRMGPNIVLFNGVLSVDERRQCLVLCRKEKISAIVVDRAVAAFVATTSPRSFSATQQLTLPYTCFSHYATVSGHVPDEVFVGRRGEQAQLEAMTGSMFVYGGRQLGKSALLRKIQRDFADVDDQQAIYIDLSTKGLGSWGEPLEFWKSLYTELANVGIVARDNRVHKPEPVTRAVRDWLDNKPGRRLLLLLDEADKFLEAESASGFPNISPLKELFDSTGGRCKPIFAGLHKVQRLQNVANTPLAHGGQDILVGPLSGPAALELVVGPLQALGYDFEEQTLAWRLLAHTNLQPGLIQIVCIGLIEHLQTRALASDEPLVSITAADIEAVTQNPRIRRDIADRLRLTITLEDRFHVIALVMAVMGMESDFREVYSPAEIREHCELYWEDGFRGLNTAEFGLYLEEMEGLGVLSPDGNGNYSMRSPNIVSMLGTKAELETTLRENEFQLPDDFNPKSARREVTLASGESVRSPLTEQQLAELLPNAASHAAKNFIVVGSVALGVSAVIPTLNDVALNRGITVTLVDAASETFGSELNEFKFAVGGTGRPRCLVVDATTVDHSVAVKVASAVGKMRRRSRGHLIMVFGQTALGAVARFFDHESVVETRMVHTGRWTRDGLRSWQDNPFASPSMQASLLDTSRGWPSLIAEAIDNVTGGRSHSEELSRLEQFPADRETAEQFLACVGVTEASARGLLRTWYDYTDETLESVSEIAAVLDIDSSDMYDFVDQFIALGAVDKIGDKYRVDKVVARALNRLATP